jgi:hypothetical protein
MLFIGIFLLVLAGIFFFIARGQKAKAGKLAGTDMYDAATLQALHERIAGSLGADALAEQCEVSGIIEAEQPLQGKLSGKAVVWYRATVTREYEEQVTRRDEDGKLETVTESGSEQIEAHKEHIDFYVRDPSGRVRIDPDAADLELVETHNSLTSPEEEQIGKRRITGIRSVERALPVGSQVFIHGCAIDRGGEVVIAKHPHKGDEKFIISLRSERELLQSASGTARNMQVAAGACGGLGALLTILGLVL